MKSIFKTLLFSILFLSIQIIYAQEEQKSIELISKNQKMIEADILDYLIILEEEKNNDITLDTEESEEEKKEIVKQKLESPKAKFEKLKKALASDLGIPENAIQPASTFPPASFRNNNGSNIKISIDKSQRANFEKKLSTTKAIAIAEWKISKSSLNQQTRMEAEKNLLNEAIDLAINKAKFIAQAKGLTLGELIGIEEVDKSNALEQLYPENFTQIYMEMLGSSSGDKVKVEVIVKVKFKLK